MAEQQKKKNTLFPQIGSVIERRNKETGEPERDENGNKTYYLKIDKDVQLTVNGKKVEGYLQVSRPRDKYDRMLAKEAITPDEHKIKVADFEPGGERSYITFELSADLRDKQK